MCVCTFRLECSKCVFVHLDWSAVSVCRGGGGGGGGGRGAGCVCVCVCAPFPFMLFTSL